MRELLLGLTILGGVLSLAAAAIVVVQSVRARLKEAHIRRLDVTHGLKIQDHDRRYAEWTAEPDPALWDSEPPFGQPDMNAHGQQIEDWYRREYRGIMGYERGDDHLSESLRVDLIARLLGPALLAGVGTVLSTWAGAASLFLE